MLLKRTNILFEDDFWQKLVAISHELGISAGEMIRRAVQKTYLDSDQESQKKKAYFRILDNRVKSKGWNYRKLISYGRKY